MLKPDAKAVQLLTKTTANTLPVWVLNHISSKFGLWTDKTKIYAQVKRENISCAYFYFSPNFTISPK